MSKLKEPLPAKLIVSLLYKDSAIAQECWKTLDEIWGPFDFLSEIRPFHYTTYYQKEMGGPLIRRWASFQPLVPQEALMAIKHRVQTLEGQWSQQEKRQINIDPGLLSAERLVLATGKNYSHRIYLGRGVFADLALLFYQGGYHPLPWTYPDYQEPEALWMFNKVRDRYLRDLEEKKVLTL